MKYLIIFIFLFSCCSSKEEKQGQLKYEKYINISVNTFLKENKGYSYLKIESRKPGVASSMLVSYPLDSVKIEIFPEKFEFMNAYDENGKWNIEEFKKEKISIIRVLKNDKVVNVIPYKKTFFNNID